MNGKHLKRGLELATELMEREVEFINAINVYPVADGDTGTNMHSTMAGIVDALRDVDTDHAGRVAEVVAEAALETARGNSGVILSQFFWGFYEGVGNADVMDRNLVVAAFNEGKDWAYQAVSNPVEGTILTVMRETAEGAQRLVKTSESVPELLHNVYQTSLTSLEKAPEMLGRLGKPKIIDSGAYGFTLLVEGFARAMGLNVRGYRVRGMRAERESGGGGSNLFCTNYMIELNNGATSDEIRAVIDGKGDSIVVVGGNNRIKVHIHTDNPGLIRELLQSFGRVVQERIDRIW